MSPTNELYITLVPKFLSRQNTHNFFQMLSLSELSNMNLEAEEGVAVELPRSDILTDNNPIFSPCYLSSKVKLLISLINERFVKSADKILIVSEWVRLETSCIANKIKLIDFRFHIYVSLGHNWRYV